MKSFDKYSEEGKQGYFDSPEEVDRKIDELAKLIKASAHFIALTGVGLSNGDGIQDYKYGTKAVMPTEAGSWEKKSNIKAPKKKGKFKYAPIKEEYGVAIRNE